MSSQVHQLMVRGVAAHQEGRLGDAELIYRGVLEGEPLNGDALHLLGVVLHQLGRSEEGWGFIERAMGVRPGVVEFMVNGGEVLRALGKYEEALAMFERAAGVNGSVPELYNNMASVQMALRQYEGAEVSLRRALELRPGFAEAWTNLGNLTDRRGDAAGAIPFYEKSLRLKPVNAEALTNLGNILARLHRSEEAMGALKRSLEINPRLGKTYNNLGNVMQLRGMIAESLEAYRTGMSLDRRNFSTHSNYLLALNRDPGKSAGEIFAAHVAFGRELAGARRRMPGVVRGEHGRLRIGYVSPDLRKHSVASFMEPILRHHDHSRFHITCYADVMRPDETTGRLRGLCDGWRDVTGLSDEKLAGVVRGDEIDVLVDLAGHTEGNRLGMFAMKPAPMQVTYLGYPNTTGVEGMDYRITDGLADSVGVADLVHTERLLRMPVSAWCYGVPGELPEIRRGGGRGMTFGCFNNVVKITPGVVGMWGRLLREVAGSRLVIKSLGFSDGAVRGRLMERFAGEGIEEGRVELRLPVVSGGEHLGMYNEIDIALDTYPYHGTTTTCEALVMGVPVVTLAGETHVSRVGVSLLTNAGVGELIGESEEEYVGIAAGLARDGKRLGGYHERLRGQFMSSVICDGGRFTRELEGVYLGGWKAIVEAR